MAQGNARPPAKDRLLICNKFEHTVSIFSVAERKELAVLKTGRGPHLVAVSPDGRTAVVTNYGNLEAGHSVTIIDVVAAVVIGHVDLHQPGRGDGDNKFLRPHGVQFPSAHAVLVTSEARRQLLHVDLRTGKVEHTWPTSQPTMHMVAVARDGKWAATTSAVDGTVAFFDLSNKSNPGATMQAPITTGEGAEGLAVHPISGDAWVANRADHTLSIVCRRTGKVRKTLHTATAPFRITFTADGLHALLTCTKSGELQIFDADTQTLVSEVSIHGDRSEQSSLPLAVVSGADSRFAYVACARGEFIAIVDLHRTQLIDRIDARKGPGGLAYARPRALTIKR